MCSILVCAPVVRLRIIYGVASPLGLALGQHHSPLPSVLPNKIVFCAGSGQAESKSSAAAVAHWTVFAVCAVAAIGAGVAFWQWRRRQNQTAEGYLAMSAMDDESEAGQPMVAPTTSLRQSM